MAQHRAVKLRSRQLLAYIRQGLGDHTSKQAIELVVVKRDQCRTHLRQRQLCHRRVGGTRIKQVLSRKTAQMLAWPGAGQQTGLQVTRGGERLQRRQPITEPIGT